MRKLLLGIVLTGYAAIAQDTLKTSTLQEVVVTGTRFELPVGKSGKSIFKFSREQLEQNAGKSLADLLNEIPGVQTEGNFGAPGSNQSYFVRGGRNRQTLVLIDGVPLTDPSSIGAEYDLRYIPLSQVESVEVLKGGLSTLYGTGAAAGVINITLRQPGDTGLSGEFGAEVASWNTWSQNLLISGGDRLSWMLSANNITSDGFSSAADMDPLSEFDDDGLSRQNALVKFGFTISENFEIQADGAYEQFEAGYDDYEFADAPNQQDFNQWRIGIRPKVSYDKGNVQGRFVLNKSERVFKSSFPEHDLGTNFQGEIVHRHLFSEHLQTVAGINLQHMSMEQTGIISNDSARFSMVDPYVSLFADFPSGFNLHAGARLNTHNLYGSEFIYNINPAVLLNRNGAWRYKLLLSAATSYITPSLYQLYSFAGNTGLRPERAFNFEGGVSAYHQRLGINAVYFNRDETNPIDFISRFDDEGIYIGGQYQNIADTRKVYGLELDFSYAATKSISVTGNFTWMDTDKPTAFYKIPNVKYGAAVVVNPLPGGTFSIKYNYTGDRTTFDFASFSEVVMDSYNVIDVYAEWSFIKKSLTIYGAVNNAFDEDFVALYGYTTKGRNFSAGVRYRF